MFFHKNLPFVIKMRVEIKNPLSDKPESGFKNSSSGFTAGFGTLQKLQVAGLHRACPSVTLDKQMLLNL